MNLTLIYILALFALSGLGITFINPESLLALCFFIFFGLSVHYSQPLRQALEDLRQSVEADLLSLMIDAQNVNLVFKTAQLAKTNQCLLACRELDSPLKF